MVVKILATGLQTLTETTANGTCRTTHNVAFTMTKTSLQVKCVAAVVAMQESKLAKTLQMERQTVEVMTVAGMPLALIRDVVLMTTATSIQSRCAAHVAGGSFSQTLCLISQT